MGLRRDAVREAVCGVGSAFLTPEAIARRLDVPVGEVLDALADLEDDGVIESCVSGDGLAFRVTEGGAETLRLRPHEGGWASAGIDVDQCLAREAKRNWAGPLRCDRAGFPYPSVLLGASLPWANSHAGVCPACKGLPLEPHVYCLRCDAWGLEQAECRERTSYEPSAA